MDQELKKAIEARDKLKQISPSACTVKWKHATINLAAGQVKSCCHHSFRDIENQSNSAGHQFHETLADIQERKQMLVGERPENCRYCWWIEDNGHLSDRATWSSKTFMAPFMDDVAQANSALAQNPSWIELNFSNVCNLRCSYCSPIFSTSWLREIESFGPYPTQQPHNVLKNMQGLTKLDGKQQEALSERFWPWFETVYSDLRLLKITGGEPLLSPHTLKVFDRIIVQPNTKLCLSVNSNLICTENIWNEFVTKIKTVREGKMLKHFYLHPSVDSFGDRAEYIRFGLDFQIFKNHVEDYLKRTDGHLIFICTLNNLSLGGLRDLWVYLLDLKQRFGSEARVISIGTELLQSPDWQNLNILPLSFESYLEETIQFVRDHIGPSKKDFSIQELQGLQRARDIFKTPPKEIAKHRADFYRFFKEHDRRRGTDFAATFPELADFYAQCRKLELCTNEPNSLPEIMPLAESRVRLQVTLAPERSGESGEASADDSDLSEKSLRLVYTLAESKTAAKWLQLLKQDIEEKKQFWFNGIFYGRAFEKNELTLLAQELTQILNDIELENGALFKEFKRHTYTLADLDRIHKFKVELIRLADSQGFEFPYLYRKKLDCLNFVVHRLEISLTCDNRFAAVVGVPMPPARLPLEAEDVETFTQDDLFGGLYLDYATNGVEPTDGFRNSNSEKPTPQSTVSSGFQLYFGRDKKFAHRPQFDAWIQENHPELLKAPNVAFGRSLLGQLDVREDEKPHLQAALAKMRVIESIEVLGET